MKLYRTILLGILILLPLQQGVLGAPVASSAQRIVETRGIWLRPPSNPDDIPAILDTITTAGFNAVFVETFYHGFTIFPSKYVPIRPEYKDVDLLKIFVEEGRERGLEIHCWIEVFYWMVDTEDYPQFPRTPLFDGHEDWLLRLRDGSTTEKAETAHIFANPAHPRVRALLIDFFKEIVTRYDVAGLNLDYIRYPAGGKGKDAGYDDFTRNLFMEQMWGVDPADIAQNEESALWEKWVNWRENMVTTFLYQTRTALNRHAPGIIVSADIFPGYYESRYSHTTYQDWKTWIDLGLIDFIIPMAYAGSLEGVRKEIQHVTSHATGKEVSVIPGIAVAKRTADAFGGPGHPPLAQQVTMIREIGLKGHVVFCYSWLMDSDENLATLRNTIYEPLPEPFHPISE